MDVSTMQMKTRRKIKRGVGSNDKTSVWVKSSDCPEKKFSFLLYVEQHLNLYCINKDDSFNQLNERLVALFSFPKASTHRRSTQTDVL